MFISLNVDTCFEVCNFGYRDNIDFLSASSMTWLGIEGQTLEMTILLAGIIACIYYDNYSVKSGGRALGDYRDN